VAVTQKCYIKRYIKVLKLLQDIHIPLSFTCKGPGVIHGVACWFDVQFPGTQQPMWLSTAPGMAATHWFQLRCVLQVLPLSLQDTGLPVLVIVNDRFFLNEFLLVDEMECGALQSCFLRTVFDD
jgi:hypothetical protein